MKMLRPGQNTPYSGVVKQPQRVENNSSNLRVNPVTPVQSVAPAQASTINRREIDIPVPKFRAQTSSVGDNELTSANLAKILDKNSPLMRRAKTKGMQYANERGLVNSTIGGDSATGEMIDRGTEIATSDANAYLEQKLANQRESNAMLRQNSEQAHQSREAELDRIFDLDVQQAENQQELDLQTRDINQQRYEQAFQSQEDEAIRNFQAAQNEIERQFQGDESAAERELARDQLAQETATELFRQVAGQQASLLDAIATVQAADLEGENKQALVNTLIDLSANSLQTTSVLADFTVQEGQVVYNEPEEKEEVTQPEPEVPYWQRPGFRGFPGMGGFNF